MLDLNNDFQILMKLNETKWNQNQNFKALKVPFKTMRHLMKIFPDLFIQPER